MCRLQTKVSPKESHCILTQFINTTIYFHKTHVPSSMGHKFATMTTATTSSTITMMQNMTKMTMDDHDGDGDDDDDDEEEENEGRMRKRII